MSVTFITISALSEVILLSDCPEIKQLLIAIAYWCADNLIFSIKVLYERNNIREDDVQKYLKSILIKRHSCRATKGPETLCRGLHGLRTEC